MEYRGLLCTLAIVSTRQIWYGGISFHLTLNTMEWPEMVKINFDFRYIISLQLNFTVIKDYEGKYPGKKLVKLVP